MAIPAPAGVTNFFSAESGAGGTAPKAYLHVLLFDDRFKFDNVNSYVAQVSRSPGKNTFDKFGANAVNVKKNGYAYIYISNESDELVYFDNLLFTHERGRILEETHYYPFGLTMAGISSKAAGSMDNKRKWNAGSELNTDFDLSLYETYYRSLDPQTGRFWQIHPMADFSLQYSPYAFANNDPVLMNDQLGLFSDSAHPHVLPAVVVSAKATKLEGGDYSNKYFFEISTSHVIAPGYSSFTIKTRISHEKLRSFFDDWIKELNRSAKLYGYASALLRGSVIDLKSLKDYKEIIKKLIKEKKIKINNPLLIVIGTIAGLRAEQFADNADKLTNILVDYGLMHSSEGTFGKGILVIQTQTTVSAMGESSYSATTNFYDADSKKYIGKLYEIY